MMADPILAKMKSCGTRANSLERRKEMARMRRPEKEISGTDTCVKALNGKIGYHSSILVLVLRVIGY